MADELRDLRAKITVETDVVLDAIMKVRGIERSEIVRDVLHKFALEQIALSTVIQVGLNSEGDDRAAEGIRGREGK